MATSAITANIRGGQYYVEKKGKPSMGLCSSIVTFGDDQGYRFLQAIEKTIKLFSQVTAQFGFQVSQGTAEVLGKLASGTGAAWPWVTVASVPLNLQKCAGNLVEFASSLKGMDLGKIEKLAREIFDNLSIILYGALSILNCIPLIDYLVPSVKAAATFADAAYNLLAFWNCTLIRKDALEQAEELKNNLVVANGLHEEARYHLLKMAKSTCSLAGIAFTCLTPYGFVAPKLLELTVSLSSTVFAIAAGSYNLNRQYELVVPQPSQY